MQHGPHRGRWVLPYCKGSTTKDKYAAHTLAVFSDDGGKNWTQGALTPAYAGEAAITELGNGSLLMSFRSEGEHMPSHPHYRGFARSDVSAATATVGLARVAATLTGDRCCEQDGGATWAEVWYANDPGRATGMIDAPSDQGIDRSEKTG